MRVVIFGASGFLGSKLKEFLSSEGYEVISADINPLGQIKRIDALNLSEVVNFLNKFKPSVVIDTIALSSSLECEKDPSLAMDLNFTTAKNISFACKKIDCQLIFFSSSYVFDGKRGDYSETDIPNPINVYGKTKEMAEKEVLHVNKGVVLRPDLILGLSDNQKNFLTRITLGEKILLSEPDQIRQPTVIEDLCEVVKKAIQFEFKGVYHVCGKDKITIAELYKKLISALKSKSDLAFTKNPKIKVPLNCTLSNKKIMSKGVTFHHLENFLLTLKKKQL